MASFISASLLVPGSTPPATRSFAGPARASTCLRQALGLATGQSLALETARLGRTCRAQQTKRAQDICGGCGGCCAGCDLDRNLILNICIRADIMNRREWLRTAIIVG